MIDLSTIQRQFLTNMLDAENNNILQYIKGGKNAGQRLEIHRRTINEALYSALKITFPGIWALTGDKQAKNIALDFIKQASNLPTTSCLDEWGSSFPAFLEKYLADDMKYLEDYGKLEWLVHLSSCAAEAAILDPSELQKVPAEQIDNLHFIFHPATFFFRSRFRLDLIQTSLNNLTNKNNSAITYPNSDEIYAVLTRNNETVETFWVLKDCWNFLYSLKEGKSLKEAILHATNINAGFDLTAILSFMLGKGLVTSFV